MTPSLTCTRTASLEAGSVHSWETAEGVTGSILIDPEGPVARPCTPQGRVFGDTVLDRDRGNTENPGRLPDGITRTYR